MTLTSRDSTAVSSPMNCQYSCAVSVNLLAAPLATYSTVKTAVASVTSKLSCTVTTPAPGSTAKVPTSPLAMPTTAYSESSYGTVVAGSPAAGPDAPRTMISSEPSVARSQ